MDDMNKIKSRARQGVDDEIERKKIDAEKARIYKRTGFWAKLLSLIKDQFAESDDEYFESKEAGIITDQQEIARHLYLVSVR